MIPFAYYHPAAAAAGTASRNTHWSTRLRMKQSCHVHLLNPLAKCPEGPQCKPHARRQAAKMLEKCRIISGKKYSDQVRPGNFCRARWINPRSVQAMDF